MRKFLIAAAAIAILAGAGLFATRATSVPESEIAGITPDLARGALVFQVSGCASCHAADGAEGEDRLVLSGGHRLATPFGTFVAPNISQDSEYGIGGWSRAEVVTAIMNGTSPEGRHYFPAFPYAAYQKADLDDIVSLAAYLETLPADATPSEAHDLRFPFSIRAGVGFWKLFNMSGDWAVPVPETDTQLVRGRYLAEALGHCGECHTPRTLTQGLDRSRWLAGAPNPSGRGTIPNITPAKLDWGPRDLVAYFETGFRPDYDVAGGSMVDVIEGLKALPASDLDALAAYVKSVPPSE